MRNIDIKVIIHVAKFVNRSAELQDFLFKQVYSTRQRADDISIKRSANAMTLLNLSKVSLSGLDLSGTYFNGAILMNAIMQETNLDGVDLTDVQLNGAFLIGANSQSFASKTKSQPLIRYFEGHGAPVYTLDTSYDGKYIASGGEDLVIRVWKDEA